MPEAVRRYLVALSMVAVAVTLPLWLGQLRRPAEDELEQQRAIRKARMEIWNKPLSEGRCVITSATFGGGQARLVRAEKDGIVFYAVLEGSPRKVPMNALYQSDWLRGHFGNAETATLAIYRSPEMALARASQLCPPKLRCLPGRPGCEAAGTPDPLQLFTGMSASRPAFSWEGTRPSAWPEASPATSR
ncbi:MAG: hypothetical protein EKK41_23760 [Hyphomicrobiales bacterium]|nr:MAG: hypothetical protein EKK41_23760 [Hyphomicrobiales bacterium]